MIPKILSWLFSHKKKAYVTHHEAIRRPVDRSYLQPEKTRQKATMTLLSGSVLQAVEAWRPPKGAVVQMVVCVGLGGRVLFHAIKERESAGEVVSQLDKLAHCLLVTEEPDLPDEWVNELDITWNLFEENVSNV